MKEYQVDVAFAVIAETADEALAIVRGQIQRIAEMTAIGKELLATPTRMARVSSAHDPKGTWLGPLFKENK